MERWGKYLGYSSEPCPNCGRFRLERYENGKEVCEKCGWCPQNDEYVDRERMYEEDYRCPSFEPDVMSLEEAYEIMANMKVSFESLSPREKKAKQIIKEQYRKKGLHIPEVGEK